MPDQIVSAAQHSAVDFVYAGHRVQLKTASKPDKKGGSTYGFHLTHGHTGNRRPYEAGLAFAFTVVGCNDRCYFVPAEAAKKQKLVGENAPAKIRLRHPHECKKGDRLAEFLLPKPEEEESPQ
jgi:hypothetical protein